MREPGLWVGLRLASRDRVACFLWFGREEYVVVYLSVEEYEAFVV